MKQPKSFYKSLNHAGYAWGGFWDGMHHFVKHGYHDGAYITGYLEAKVSESDIEDGSYTFMLDNELTRV